MLLANSVKVVLGTTFQLTLKILVFLDQICPKREKTVNKGKRDQHH